jgi:hypothetical protein
MGQADHGAASSTALQGHIHDNSDAAPIGSTRDRGTDFHSVVITGRSDLESAPRFATIDP